MSAAAAATHDACRAPRLALAIGNARYAAGDAPLPKSEGDAKAVATAFSKLGFAVKEGENLNRSAMLAALEDVLGRIRQDAVVALFFSGYALQAGDHTYLLPVDAAIRSEADIKAVGFDLDGLLAAMADRGARLRMVIVDGARRDPFESRFRPAGPAGLAAVAGTPGVLALYAVVPGATADDDGASPLVGALVTAMARPGAMAEESFRRARQDTARASHGSRTPWVSSFLDQDVALTPKDCNPAQTEVAAAAPRNLLASPLPAPVGAPAAPPPTPRPAPSPVAVGPADTPPPAAPPSAAPPSAVAPSAAAASPASPPSAPAPVTAQAAPATHTPAVLPPVAPASPGPLPPPAEDDGVIDDAGRLREMAERLFDQGLDPGEPGTPAMTTAIRTYQQHSGLPADGLPTARLLSRLRVAAAPSPWGAIAFARNDRRWGMAWAGATRRIALDDAKRRCGSADCNDVTTFSGHQCGAFALSPVGWSITWRDDEALAREAALDLCGRRGSTCQIVGQVCADGSGHVSPTRNDRQER